MCSFQLFFQVLVNVTKTGIVILILLLGSGHFGFSQHSKTESLFRLNGKILGIDSGTIHLEYIRGNDLRVFDSVRIIEGSFIFSGFIEEPTLAYLYLDSRNIYDANTTGIFLESGVQHVLLQHGSFD